MKCFVFINTILVMFFAIACRGTGSLTDGASDISEAAGAGTLSLLVVPPSRSLDWRSPNDLALSVMQAKVQGQINKQLGRVIFTHDVGHVYVKLDCGDNSIGYTGQTGSGAEYTSAFDGVGASFRTFDGYLEPGPDIAKDVAARQASGNIAIMNFRVNQAACAHMRDFLNEYINRGAYRYYGGQFRPRRFEGAGCTAFALAFVEIGGLMDRSLFTPHWARNVDVGLGRIADYQGSGEYRYGSNLISYGADGTMKRWPKDSAIKVQTAAISPGSPWLSVWSAANDAGTNVDPSSQPDTVPWTIYDPELMYAFAMSVVNAGGGNHLGRNWTVGAEHNAYTIETDATDAQIRPHWDEEDDLRK